MKQLVSFSMEDWLSGSVMLSLLLLGLLFSAKSRFFQLRRCFSITRSTLGSLFAKTDSSQSSPNLSSFQAVTTALAGTMGVGNLAGVATAILAGGPGAIFWMWVSAFLGMMTKYAEIFLAVRFRQKDKNGVFRGGPMYYMEHGLDSKPLAIVFSIACILASFGIGNMTQVNSVSTAALSSFGVPLWVTGLVIAAICAAIIVGGLKRIGQATEAFIPLISIVYLFGSCLFLYLHRQQILPTLSFIVSEAFSLRPLAGGVGGYTISAAIRFGTARGVFTNEAGLGSAPMAHAAADCKTPGQQALWGIVEVFLDTLVVCTITALIILMADNGRLWRSGVDGAPLTSLAFETAFGAAGGYFVTISIAFFAIPAILGWCFYGECAIMYLFGKNKLGASVYRLLFLAAIVVGAVADLRVIWTVSDFLNACMAIPNAAALFLLRHHVKYDGKKRSAEKETQTARSKMQAKLAARGRP